MRASERVRRARAASIIDVVATSGVLSPFFLFENMGWAMKAFLSVLWALLFVFVYLKIYKPFKKRYQDQANRQNGYQKHQ
jgi:hypothetical protein